MPSVTPCDKTIIFNMKMTDQNSMAQGSYSCWQLEYQYILLKFF